MRPEKPPYDVSAGRQARGRGLFPKLQKTEKESPEKGRVQIPGTLMRG